MGIFVSIQKVILLLRFLLIIARNLKRTEVYSSRWDTRTAKKSEFSLFSLFFGELVSEVNCSWMVLVLSFWFFASLSVSFFFFCISVFSQLTCFLQTIKYYGDDWRIVWNKDHIVLNEMKIRSCKYKWVAMVSYKGFWCGRMVGWVWVWAQ